MADEPIVGPVGFFHCNESFTEVPPSKTGVTIFLFRCPVCEGEGRWGSGERCMECIGRGLLTAEEASKWAGSVVFELVPLPAPPGVMRSPCADCAFRPGAPEEDERPPLDRPFFCHHGMPVVDGSYAPTAWADGRPLGAMVCAGWWAAATGRELPAEAYRPARDGWGESGRG